METILLLFALKIKFPENIVLLRGSHEDRQVNRVLGFGDECAAKFKENLDDQYSFFSRINRLFEKLFSASPKSCPMPHRKAALCLTEALFETLAEISFLRDFWARQAVPRDYRALAGCSTHKEPTARECHGSPIGRPMIFPLCSLPAIEAIMQI